MSVWIYTRKSRALGDPEDDPHILAHQREALLRLAASLGLSEPAIIEEVGSGEELIHRPRLSALLDEWDRCPPREGGRLLCTALDRLSRGTQREVGEIRDRIAAAGVKVRTLAQEFDLSNPDDQLVFGMLTVVGRYGLERYRHDVRLRMEQLTRKGELTTGSAPYGYRWQKGKGKERGRLEPVPEEFAAVQALFRDAPHLSMAKLSARYQIPRPTVFYILHNPVYTGWPHRHTAWKKREDGKTSSRILPEHQWGLKAERPGNYPPAVTVEQFYAVRQALQRRWCERAKTTEADGWCRRLLVLEGWEGARTQLGSIDHEKTPCYTFIHPETKSRRSYPREPIHAAATEAILATFNNIESLKRAIASWEERQAGSQGDRDRLRMELETLRGKLADLTVEMAGSDSEDRLALSTARERIKAAIRAAQTALGQVTHSRTTGGSFALLEPFLSKLGTRAGRMWAEASPAEKATIAEDLLETVVVRIECPGRRRPCSREIVRVEYAAWFQRFL